VITTDLLILQHKAAEQLTASSYLPTHGCTAATFCCIIISTFRHQAPALTASPLLRHSCEKLSVDKKPIKVAANARTARHSPPH
jgi:hypothetical protein